MFKVQDAGLKFTGLFNFRTQTSHLVLHHAAGSGSVEAIHTAHLSRGWYGIGYHYYVRKDGTIWRGRPEGTVGAHAAGGYPASNTNAIGVCFEGNFEVEQMPDKQLEAGRWLVADITARNPGIAVSGHRDNTATACPGRSFPMEKMLAPALPFGDIEGHWAKDAVMRCYEAGIITQSKSGNFRPNDPVTRAELATVISKLIK